MSVALENERMRRKRWLASMLGEPAEDVMLVPDVEPVEPDMHKCGAGRGADCCIFLTCGPYGFICERNGPTDDYLRKRAQSGGMNAQRAPEEAYPECMRFSDKEEDTP